MLISEQNFKLHLEAFAYELFTCICICIYIYIYTVYIYIRAVKVNALTQINFNGTNFFNARLTQRVFPVWPVAQPIVGEMEMHSVDKLSLEYTTRFLPRFPPDFTVWTSWR